MAARPACASWAAPCGRSAARVSRSRPAGAARSPHRTHPRQGPLLLAQATEPIRQAKAAAEAAQLARARRVGRDLGVVNRSDYGHGIRLVPIRGPGGAILREADVVVGDEPDPRRPKAPCDGHDGTDPLEVLKRAGTINAREFEAGEKLRDAIERSQPSLPGMFRSEVRVAPRDRVAITEQQLKACQCVRRALAVLDNVVAPAVLWIVRDGGTIRGYAASAHVRHTTAAELLRRGLGALADHYGSPRLGPRSMPVAQTTALGENRPPVLGDYRGNSAFDKSSADQTAQRDARCAMVCGSSVRGSLAGSARMASKASRIGFRRICPLYYKTGSGLMCLQA